MRSSRRAPRPAGIAGFSCPTIFPRKPGTFALVPQVVDAVKVPVIAAGGIADARGIAAAFALGAAGVQIGTAYLHCPEFEDFRAASRGAQGVAGHEHHAHQRDERPARRAASSTG